ncbi:hypothetical protein MCUN1_003476 [Malassezia cuniculi]|uniref:Ras-related protein Rab-18 n=1 Tax=Malassezia cuniculi TaxID=948313 RepID=A0AAF0F1L9_9BASI|nr:hypothetical protein MCUN1_003476 [Malassezia cuniculi]
MAEPTTTDELPTLKVLLLGASGVGKSAIVRRYTDDDFVDESEATIGVDYRTKSIRSGGKWFRLRVWDTAGQERYRTLTRGYYRGAQGVILVYDVTDSESFDALTTWLSEVEAFCGAPAPIRLIVGNKTDRQRVVPREDGAAFAKRVGALFAECSAKEGEGVAEAFSELCGAGYPATG